MNRRVGSRLAVGLASCVLAAGLLTSCGRAPASDSEVNGPGVATAPYASEYSAASHGKLDEREPFDEDGARDIAEDEVAGESYADIGAPYGCTDDCSGHEAGFRYRAENGYAGHSPDSPSFNEGGQAFEDAVEERVEEMRSEYERR